MLGSLNDRQINLCTHSRMGWFCPSNQGSTPIDTGSNEKEKSNDIDDKPISKGIQ